MVKAGMSAAADTTAFASTFRHWIVKSIVS
jgi:hypothetical protein